MLLAAQPTVNSISSDYVGQTTQNTSQTTTKPNPKNLFIVGKTRGYWLSKTLSVQTEQCQTIKRHASSAPIAPPKLETGVSFVEAVKLGRKTSKLHATSTALTNELNH